MFQVLHKIGAERASAAVVTLDSPGANYRTVWALSKSFPKVKTFVRAHDVDHGLNLEKAGATAVSYFDYFSINFSSLVELFYYTSSLQVLYIVVKLHRSCMSLCSYK